MTAPRITTAEALGRLYNELIKAGIPQELVVDIVRDAAHAVIAQEGFAVDHAEQVAA